MDVHGLRELAGMLPAIIFPVATGRGVFWALRTKHPEEVDKLLWLAFGVANFALWFYTGVVSVQTIIALGATGLADFAIVGIAFARRRRSQ